MPQHPQKLLRAAGLGRLLYQAWHRPRTFLSETARAGGFLERWRTARGAAAMESAARRLPPLPEAPPEAPELHFLTGPRLWYQTVFFLHSLAPHLAVRPVIHDDGRIDDPTRAALLRALPSATLVSDIEARARLDRLLPVSRFPFLRERRENLVLFRKLLDVHAGRAGWTLFCDSDMLVFRRPDLLLAWLNAPSRCIHMTDATRAYGYELDVLQQLAGAPVPDLVNTGLLGLDSSAIDWEKMEYWCRVLIERYGTHYYQEQALFALHLAHQPHGAFPATDYLVLPDDQEAQNPGAAIHHYVASSKRWYLRDNWRRFVPAA